MKQSTKMSQFHKCPVKLRLNGSSRTWCLIGRIFLLAYLFLQAPSAATEFGSDTAIEVLEGNQVLLPCKHYNNEAIMVLIFQGFTGAPIYSIDYRGYNTRPTVHNSSLEIGRGTYFSRDSSPPGLVLLHVLRQRDQGHYRCRVDFRDAPSRETRVHLNIIVLPRKMTIYDNNKLEVSDLAGPYALNSPVTFTCTVSSGQPTPKITWWLESKLIDDYSEFKEEIVTKNTMFLAPLSKTDLFKNFTCKASNTNLSAPIESRITIDISFPPEEVKILDFRTPQIEGRSYSIICESSGSRPSVNISWYKDGRLVDVSKIFREGAITRSTVQLTPTADDNGSRLTCRVKNDLLPSKVIERSIALNVLYPPHVSLSLGGNLNVADIREGVDVYFECAVIANPNQYQIHWLKDGRKLLHNISKGIIMSNMSLVLQKVMHNTAGRYTCSAYNSQGRGVSKTISLKVKYSPVCQPNQKTTYTFGIYKSMNVTCNVISDPKPLDFRWDFNTTSGVVAVPKKNYWEESSGSSTVQFTPQQQLESGTLLCWARNALGLQVKPCVYQIIQEAPPEAVKNCAVVNITSNEAFIRCQPGWDGGLSQRFSMSVSHQNQQLNEEGPKLLAYTSISPRPEFVLSPLESDMKYIITITSVNQKGTSEAVELALKTPKYLAHTTVTSSHEDVINPVLALLSSIIAIILLVMFIAAIVVRNRHSVKTQRQNKIIDDEISEETKQITTNHLKRNIYEPDVIPMSTEEFHRHKHPKEHLKEIKDAQRNIENGSRMAQQQLYEQIDKTKNSEICHFSNSIPHANKTVTFGEIEEVSEPDYECILDYPERKSCRSLSSPEIYKYPQHSTPINDRIPPIPHHFSTLIPPRKRLYLHDSMSLPRNLHNNMSLPRNGYRVSKHGQLSHISSSYIERSMFHEGTFNRDLVLYHERISTHTPRKKNAKRFSLSKLESPV